MKKLLLVPLGTLTAFTASATADMPADEMARSFDLDMIWVLLSAALIFFMQAGFKCLEVGFVRKHQIAAIAMKNTVDWTVGSVIFFVLDFGLMFGHPAGGWSGTDMFLPSTFAVEDKEELIF